ncbi:hypothetical protein [Massilia aquatica]|uniref:Uncharacterized protein n=1 Tax=Massilia aquatica TaxID=2609000 RepID=A0ABX0MBP7_9BURK|nr:hypothetical protein [Massilia aquatica]NHZ44593.1 hypothetical protein [Massilia aquatica]
MITIFDITLNHLKTSTFYPLTRESVVELARSFTRDVAQEVRIAVTADEDDEELGIAVVLATVELSCTKDAEWVVQYISHPAQSSQLTESVTPVAMDFESYVRRNSGRCLVRTIEPVSAEQLEKEGLGPLAVLDLRPENTAPLVPLKADVTLLKVPSGATHST